MTFRHNQRVRIKAVHTYSFDERFPCLAIGSEGLIVEVWYHPAEWKKEVQYRVKLGCGTFPFYEEELEAVK